ncbi:MAG: glycosyltransferase family 4 protein [Gammaproteobacteria bacterium]|nr:glycosyltransferase family 4 protein [Gammaproteobacteria bacterium]
MNDIVWIALLMGGASWGLTGFLRSYALKKQLIDVPNNRSSHTVPTPRGGGVAIVVTFLLALLFLGFFNMLPADLVWALVGAGVGVALVGFIDDHGHISARWRLLVHFLCAGWALAWLGGLPPLPIFGIVLDIGWFGYLLAAFFLVWLLNLYNFMDGIDGLASIEAVTVCLSGAVLYMLVSVNNGVEIPLLLLTTTVAGFLLWNFPKAKIFMGDAGSGFVGMVLGIFTIQAAWVMPELFWGWIILLGAFVVDATVTLVRRVLRGDKFYEAHRSHAYQYASRQYKGHVSVSIAFGIINLCWLLPIAVFVSIGWLDGVAGVVVAYLPLVMLAYRFKAGANEC